MIKKHSDIFHNESGCTGIVGFFHMGRLFPSPYELTLKCKRQDLYVRPGNAQKKGISEYNKEIHRSLIRATLELITNYNIM